MMLVSAFQGMTLSGSCTGAFSSGNRVRVQQQGMQRLSVAPLTIEAAHKKGAGSTKNGRDSNSKRRGVKVYGGQPVKAGGIIIRQVGATWKAGKGTMLGNDYTLFATEPGMVHFHQSKYEKKVHIIPHSVYEKPEGQQRKPGSRNEKARKFFQEQRAEKKAALVAVAAAKL